MTTILLLSILSPLAILGALVCAAEAAIWRWWQHGRRG